MLRKKTTVFKNFRLSFMQNRYQPSAFYRTRLETNAKTKGLVLTLRRFWYNSHFYYINASFERVYISNRKYPNITGFYLCHPTMYCNLMYWSFKTMFFIFPGLVFLNKKNPKNYYRPKIKFSWIRVLICSCNIIQYLIVQCTMPPNHYHEVISTNSL